MFPLDARPPSALFPGLTAPAPRVPKPPRRPGGSLTRRRDCGRTTDRLFRVWGNGGLYPSSTSKDQDGEVSRHWVGRQGEGLGAKGTHSTPTSTEAPWLDPWCASRGCPGPCGYGEGRGSGVQCREGRGVDGASPENPLVNKGPTTRPYFSEVSL